MPAILRPKRIGWWHMSPYPYLFGLLKQKDLVAVLGSSESTEIRRLAQG